MQKIPKKRRQKITTPAQTTRIMQGVGRVIEPPPFIQLTDFEINFFNSIIGEIPKADWSAHQIELAALLSRAMGELAIAQEQLRKEGTIVTTPKGGLAVNPRQMVVDKCIATILSMRRSLSLHARVKDGDHRDLAKTRKIARQIEASVGADGGEDDGLINMPGREQYAEPEDDYSDMA